MKKIYILLSLFLAPILASAQITDFRDSVIQISGITMTSDSLRAVPAVSILVKGQNRGTVSNAAGIFSIVAFKGDTLSFSAVGFHKKDYKIPLDLVGSNFSMLQLLTEDTVHLPVTVIRPYPSRKDVERIFTSMDIPDDAYEIARKNTDRAKMRALSRYMPYDGGENFNSLMRKQQQSLYYAGQVPPQNIFNPLAWAQFLDAWKRGDFKRQD